MPRRFGDGCKMWFCMASMAYLLMVWLGVSAVQARPSYSLMHEACDPGQFSQGLPLVTQDDELSVLCSAIRVARRFAATTSQPQGRDAEHTPVLEWKSIQETEKLHPISAASAGIAWFGTIDGDVSTLNVPVIGTTLLSVSSGFLDVTSSVGVGIGGLYLQLGLEFPLYYKYPHFWSLNVVFGTTYNLGFFLNPTLEHTGFWGGGPEFILELGLVRVSWVFGVGVAGPVLHTFFPV